MTREDWLKSAGDLLLANYHIELERPWRVSSTSPKGQGSTLGHCYASSAVADGANEIFITQSEASPVKVLGILLHELVHAQDDNQNGHKGPVERRLLDLGYGRPLTTYAPTDALLAELDALAQLLPPMPMQAITPAKPKRGRMRSIWCTAEGCGFKGNTTRSHIARMPAPSICPICLSHTLQAQRED